MTKVEFKCFRCKGETITATLCRTCKQKVTLGLYKYVKEAIFQMELEMMMKGEESLFNAYLRVQEFDWNDIERRALEIRNEVDVAVMIPKITSFHQGLAPEMLEKKSNCPLCRGSGVRSDLKTQKDRPCAACKGTGKI